MLGVAATTHSAAPILGAAQAPAGTADPTRVAELLRQLREHQQEKERIRRALERVSEELREVREGSHRLFETLCQSLLGTTLGGRFEVLQRLVALRYAPWFPESEVAGFEAAGEWTADTVRAVVEQAGS